MRLKNNLQSLTTRSLDNLGRTSDFLEGHVWVISVLEPSVSIKGAKQRLISAKIYNNFNVTNLPPFTTRLESRGKRVTSGGITDTTITSSPARIRSIPLRLTTVEQTNTTTRHKQIKVSNVSTIGTQITTSVGNLNNHLLTSNGRRGEGKFVTGTAPLTFRGANKSGSSKTISKVVIDSPRLVVVTDKGVTTSTTTLHIVINYSDTILGARIYRSRDLGFTVPTTRGLTTIPVTSGLTRTGNTTRNNRVTRVTAAATARGTSRLRSCCSSARSLLGCSLFGRMRGVFFSTLLCFIGCVLLYRSLFTTIVVVVAAAAVG